MSKYRETQNKIIFDILSQIKEIFPVCDKDFYYMTMQTKLYNLALRWGLVKRLKNMAFWIESPLSGRREKKGGLLWMYKNTK